MYDGCMYRYYVDYVYIYIYIYMCALLHYMCITARGAGGHRAGTPPAAPCNNQVL